MGEQTQWQLSGNAPEAYERSLVPVIFAPWAAVLIARAALQPGERVLDVACGTGVVARLATPQVGTQGQVTGLDLNPGMLAVARSLPPVAGATIDWREGSAVALPFTKATFDVVFCQQGLQFFPDRLAALREMRRVLTPDGRLTLAVWRATQLFFSALADALTRHVSPEAGAGGRAPFALADATELRSLLTEAGFSDVHLRIEILPMRVPSLERYVPEQLAATPMAGAVAAAGESARATLLQDISTAVQAYRDDEGWAFPMEAHIVSARA
ncbi:MAG: methyltransferase domain-containing protein [Candidatus Binatia bacterium]